MTWSFSFSLWIINGVYYSDWNATNHRTPKTITVDECGPPNFISGGYALWLVLVPAIACVAQLPGSVFLYGRSNFYRFSPELGIAECLAVIALTFEAMTLGYRWDMSLVAVFAVRDGIGKNDLWWREETQRAELTIPESSGNTTELADIIADGDPSSTAVAALHSTGPSMTEEHLQGRFTPFTHPMSIERVIGMMLFSATFTKIIAILTIESRAEMLVACLLALGYSVSYLVLEALLWSVAYSFRKQRTYAISTEHLVQIVKLVDPGNNPFTFQPLLGLANPTQSRPEHDRAHRWNKKITFIFASLGITAPVLWMVILSHIWKPTLGALVLSSSAIGFLALRILGKQAYIRIRAFLTRPKPQSTATAVVEAPTRTPRPASTSTDVQYNTHGIVVFFAVWLWRRITVVNLYSAIWIAVICIYFARIFPSKVGTQSPDGRPPRKPMWLDWLG